MIAGCIVDSQYLETRDATLSTSAAMTSSSVSSGSPSSVPSCRSMGMELLSSTIKLARLKGTKDSATYIKYLHPIAAALALEGGGHTLASTLTTLSAVTRSRTMLMREACRTGGRTFAMLLTPT